MFKEILEYLFETIDEFKKSNTMKVLTYIFWCFYGVWIIIKILLWIGLVGLYLVGCDKLSQLIAYEVFGNAMGIWHFLIMMILFFSSVYLYWYFVEKFLLNED